MSIFLGNKFYHDIIRCLPFEEEDFHELQEHILNVCITPILMEDVSERLWYLNATIQNTLPEPRFLLVRIEVSQIIHAKVHAVADNVFFSK